MIIMNFAPIEYFCLIASTFATTGWDAFIPLLKYMGAVILALFIQGKWYIYGNAFYILPS